MPDPYAGHLLLLLLLLFFTRLKNKHKSDLAKIAATITAIQIHIKKHSQGSQQQYKG